jgi:hypothetical protein
MIYRQWSLPSRRGKLPEDFWADNSYQRDRVGRSFSYLRLMKNLYAL